MRKILYLFIALLPLASCGGGGRVSSAEADSLRVVTQQKDSIINEVFLSLNNITANLNQIKERESIITSTIDHGEIRQEPISQINQDINAINELLVENNNNIARLQQNLAQLRTTNARIPSLENLIRELTAQNEAQNDQINTLKDDLRTKDLEIEGLEAVIADLGAVQDELIGTVAQQVYDLNTGYYFVGPRKELLDKEIIYRKGIFGSAVRLNENTSLDYFTQVDTRYFDQVIIDRKKVELISAHPAGSYEMYTDDDGAVHMLLITDPGRFWEYSKLLVISYR